MKTSCSRPHGFALVEALIAALIFGLGALALTRLHASLLRHAEAGRQRSEATLLAQSRLDELRTALAWLPPGAPWPAEVGAFDGAAAIGRDAPPGSTAPFDRRWRVHAFEGEPTLRHLDVHVSWTDRDGRTDPGVRLALLLAARDPDHLVRAARPEAAARR